MRVDLSGAIRQSLDKALGEAREAEAQGRVEAAAAAFQHAAKLMNDYAAYAPTRSDIERRREKARSFADAAVALRSGAARANASVKQAVPATGRVGGSIASPPPSGPFRERAASVRTDYSDEIQALIHESKITWDQIGGLEQTKREIKFTYGLALARKPDGVKVSGWRRMLFYGPPGTGKTLLAAAVSNGLNATFFNVKVSDLLSKWFGESSKLISALFAAARSEADSGFSVVFMDEIESLSLPRGEGADSGAERRMLSTLLAELDGLVNKGEDRFVLTIAATNAPWDLDDAVLSRFQKRIYIPLPDAAARKAILDILLVKAGHTLRYPLDEVVERSAWFSGRDLERLSNQAVMAMIEEENGDIPDQLDHGRLLAEYQLRTRPIEKKDFDAAFQRIRVDVERYKQLERRYAEFAESN